MSRQNSLKVYVDLNAFQHQHQMEEGKYKLSEEQENILNELIQEGKISIPLSPDVTEENAPGPPEDMDLEKSRREKNFKQIIKWCNFSTPWKSADRLENEHIKNIVEQDNREIEPLFDSSQAKLADMENSELMERLLEISDKNEDRVRVKKDVLREEFLRKKGELTEKQHQEHLEYAQNLLDEVEVEGDKIDKLFHIVPGEEEVLEKAKSIFRRNGMRLDENDNDLIERIVNDPFLIYRTAVSLKIILFNYELETENDPKGLDIYDQAHSAVGIFADYFVCHDDNLRDIVQTSLSEHVDPPELLKFPDLAQKAVTS